MPLWADWAACLFSPLLAAVPTEAPKTVSVVGFSSYDREGGSSIDLNGRLEKFLVEGPTPMVFGLGSAVVHVAGDFYHKAVAVAQQLNMRAVLLVGSEEEKGLQCLASSNIFVAGYVPHSQLFPHAAGIVHQGGIGTAAQAMRAGRPQLICAYLGDQADNAERLVKLSVARRLDFKRFTVERAVAAIRELLGADITAKAAALASRIANEDGAAVVADGVAQMLSLARPPRTSTKC